MSMSNREITALEREARSREDLAKAIKSDKGKEYLKEREKLEKALGGKRKLNQADEILENAGKEAVEIVQQAERDAAELLKKADEEVAGKLAAFQRTVSEVNAMKKAAEEQIAENTRKSQELNNAALALKERETRAMEVESRQAQLGSDLAARESRVAARENAQDELDRWAAARPR